MDDEIVIEINNEKNSNKNTSKNNRKKKNKKKSKSNNINNKTEKSSKKIKNESRINSNIKKKTRLVIIKKFAIILIIIVAFVLILTSSIFNIKNIEIEGNSILSEDKIISISTLQLDTNIFKFNKKEIKEKLKENAYVEDVTIHRKLPSTVEIDIEEREPKYMLQFADSYVYINNQGYMLEISNTKLDLPILIGFTTDLSNIKAGNRINVEDLQKMDIVIKIYETAKSNDLGDSVTKIDISNEKNYVLFFESEGKKVYLGDGSNLNTKILYLKAILDASQGKDGEIFLNVDLNSENPYFRPSN